MSLPLDDELKNKFNATGTKDGVVIRLPSPFHAMTRYEAYRFSRFLENAIMDSCRISGQKIDQEFEHGRDE